MTAPAPTVSPPTLSPHPSVGDLTRDLTVQFVSMGLFDRSADVLARVATRIVRDYDRRRRHAVYEQLDVDLRHAAAAGQVHPAEPFLADADLRSKFIAAVEWQNRDLEQALGAAHAEYTAAAHAFHDQARAARIAEARDTAADLVNEAIVYDRDRVAPDDMQGWSPFLTSLLRIWCDCRHIGLVQHTGGGLRVTVQGRSNATDVHARFNGSTVAEAEGEFPDDDMWVVDVAPFESIR